VDVDEGRPFVTEMSEPEDHGETGGITEDSADLTSWLLRKSDATKCLQLETCGARSRRHSKQCRKPTP
jgi:hypothetical protein